MIGKHTRSTIVASIVAVLVFAMVPIGSNAVEVTTIDLIPEGETVTITDGGSWEPTFNAPSNVDMATLTLIGRLVFSVENGARWSMKVYTNDNEIVANDLLVDPQTHYCPNHPSFASYWEDSYYNNAWDLAYDTDFDADATSGNYYRPRTDVYEYRWAITAHVSPGSSNTVKIENVNSYGYDIELAKATVDIYADDATDVKWKTKNDISVQTFKEDLDDGTADDWSTVSGSWAVEDNTYSGSASGEAWSYYAYEFSGDITIEFKINFQTTPSGTVGKHGGIMFFANSNTVDRWSNTGYTIDWIDRDSDQGYRFYRWDSHVYLDRFYADEISTDQWYTWRITVVGDEISLYVDGDFIGSVTDDNHREGYIGLWSYNNNHIHFDDVKIWGHADVYLTTSFKVDDATSGTEYGVAMKVKNLATSDAPITITDVSLRPHGATPKSASVSDVSVSGIPNDGIELPADGSTTASFLVYMTPTFSGNHATVHLWIEFKTVCDDVYKVGVNVMFRA